MNDCGACRGTCIAEVATYMKSGRASSCARITWRIWSRKMNSLYVPLRSYAGPS